MYVYNVLQAAEEAAEGGIYLTAVLPATLTLSRRRSMYVLEVLQQQIT